MGPRTAAEGDLRLFDVVADPGQERDLAGVHPARAERGERRIRELVEEAIESRPPLVLGVGAFEASAERAVQVVAPDGGGADPRDARNRAGAAGAQQAALVERHQQAPNAHEAAPCYTAVTKVSSACYDDISYPSQDS